MRCIFCLQERPPTVEHVFPLAIGGRLTIDRVCESCNSMLGSRVDAALSDFFPIRQRRAELRLAGNAQVPPLPFDMLLGVSTLAGQPERRVQTKYDPTTGKLDHRLLHHASNVILPDGRKVRQISIDARDRDQIPKIIQRERKRHGMPPMPPDELAIEVTKWTQNVSTTSPVPIRKDLSISFAFLRHAMLKIAYELAFLWLGESYLDDPLAEQLRTAICAPDLASTDGIPGYVGEAKECKPLEFWTPHPAHHLAYVTSLLDRQIVMAVRIFDIQAAVLAVSNEPKRHLKMPNYLVPNDPKLRFMVIDSVSGRMLNTTFAEEQQRLVQGAIATGRFPLPPFPDPFDVPAAPTASSQPQLNQHGDAH
jgi:HNH endonuclease